MKVRALPLGLVFFLRVGPAFADENSARAQALFEEARVSIAKGDYASACPKFEGSQALDPGPGTQYNLAACYEKAGRTASAWATYLEAADGYNAAKKPDWEARARARAEALVSKLARVTLVAKGAPADLKITRDDKPVLASELGSAIPFDPGPHVIRATAANRPEFISKLDIAPGSARTVEIVLGQQTVEKPVVLTPPPAIEPRGGAGQRTAAFVVGGVGIAGLGFGAISGLIALNKNNTSNKDCPNDGLCASDTALSANDSARTWATISTVSFISGAVLVAAGAILYFTAPRRTTMGFRSLEVKF